MALNQREYDGRAIRRFEVSSRNDLNIVVTYPNGNFRSMTTNEISNLMP